MSWMRLNVELECVGDGDGSEEYGAGKLTRTQLHLVANEPAWRCGMQNTIIAQEETRIKDVMRQKEPLNSGLTRKPLTSYKIGRFFVELLDISCSTLPSTTCFPVL